jgi:hypothetical protein
MLRAQPINHEYLNDIYSICLQLRPFKLCILEVPGSNLSLEMRYLEVLHSLAYSVPLGNIRKVSY